MKPTEKKSKLSVPRSSKQFYYLGFLFIVIALFLAYRRGAFERTPKLKLTYFNSPGRAEPIRLAFHIGNISFHDERLNREEFAFLKPSLPCGQLPVLTIDGVVIAQSIPILRYAGKLSNLYPRHEQLKGLLIDQFMETISELYALLSKDPDVEKKRESRELVSKTTLPKKFEHLENMIQRFGSKGFVVGDSLTIADLFLYGYVKSFKDGGVDFVPTTITDAYPLINNAFKIVDSHPKVVEWNKGHQKK